MVPLFDHKLDVGVFLRDWLKMIEEEGAGVCRTRPFVTVLEDDFSTLGDEDRMTVGLGGTKTRSENWSRRCPCRHRRTGEEA